MSQLAQFVVLLVAFGLKENKTVVHMESLCRDEFAVRGTEVTVGSGSGYGGFYCVFKFDADGKYIDHACWE